MGYNKAMNNCNDTCRPGYIPGPPAPRYTSACSLEQNPTFKTYVLPASVGTDEPGQPYVPRIGEWYNAIVIYEANSNIYIYDSIGTPTRIEVGDPNNVGGAITGPKITQTVGDAVDEVMSQKAVTYEFERVAVSAETMSEGLEALKDTVATLSDKVAKLEADASIRRINESNR